MAWALRSYASTRMRETLGKRVLTIPRLLNRFIYFRSGTMHYILYFHSGSRLYILYFRSSSELFCSDVSP